MPETNIQNLEVCSECCALMTEEQTEISCLAHRFKADVPILILMGSSLSNVFCC